jgi:hypothetical protein
MEDEMSQNPTASIIEHFAEVEDPRVEYLVDHQLIDIITIAPCAVIAGADNWTEVAQNFATLRHCALNLLKHETSAKCGIQATRKKAGWSTDYLLKVLLN